MRLSSYCVGELSSPDVEVLIKHAKRSHRILEFGVGGSTTLWATFSPPDAQLTCVETNPEWIKRTQDMCSALKAPLTPRFVSFDNWEKEISGKFDLIFIDCIPDRIDVAYKAWDLLAPGGTMLWHDTHGDLGRRVFQFMSDKHLEISEVRCESATTACVRCVKRVINDVDSFEHRAPWESGHAPLPSNWPIK